MPRNTKYQKYQKKSDKPAPTGLSEFNGLTYSLEAEQGMLGAILLDAHGLFSSIKEIITSKAIYDIKHKFIFAAMWELNSENKDIDVLTVAQKLKDKNQIDKVGGKSYLSALTDHAPISIHAISYANIIREKAARRNFQQFIYEADESIKDEATPIKQLLSESSIQLQEIDNLHDNKSNSREAAAKLLTEIHWRQGRDLIGITTGFPELDEVTGGIRAHNFCLLAAGTGTGKTTAAINMAVREAQSGVHVLYLTLEVPDTDLMEKIITILSSTEDYFSYDDLNDNALSEEKFAILSRLSAEAAALPLDFIWGLDKLEDIFIAAENYKRKYPNCIVIIDHLQLIEGAADPKEFAEITKKIKNFCLLKKTPILGLCQLNNEVYKRADKEPLRSDLRGSGTLSTDTDIIFFLYKLDPESDDAYWKIDKFRKGKKNVPHYWKTIFDEDTSRFGLGEKISKPKGPSVGPGWKEKRKRKEIENEPSKPTEEEPEQLNIDY